MTNSREMRALDPALLERVRNCARQVADHIDEFGHAFDEDLHFLDKALTDYGLAISAPHAQGDVTGLVEAIREERRAYITDDYDHMALVDAFNKGLDAAIAALRQATDAEQGAVWNAAIRAAAEVARKMLVFADTTSEADKAIPEAILALAPQPRIGDKP